MKQWQEIKRSRDLYMIQTAVSTPNMWVLRGMKSIFGYDPIANQIAWEISHVDQGIVYANHEMAYLNGVVIASLFFGREDKRAWVFGFDPETGTAVWQRRVWWENGNFGRISGLKATQDHFILVEKKGESPTIVWLEPETGETIYETPGIKTNWTGVVTSQALYYYTGSKGKEKGIFRVSAQPGAKLEQVANMGVESLVAHDDNLYAHVLRENGDWVNKLIWWQASDFSQRLQMDVPEAQTYRYAKLLPTHQPHRLFMNGGNQCCLFDLQSQQVVWEQEFPERISYPSLVEEGIFLSIFDKEIKPYLLNEDTGAWQEAPFPNCECLFEMGDYRIGGESFSSRIFATASLTIPEETEVTWPKKPADTVVIESDVPVDPRDELQREILQAAANKKLDDVYKQIRQLFSTRTVPKMVKDFFTALRAGELSAGPLHFTSWDKLYLSCFTYQHLFKFGPKDAFFPAFLIASETYGVEFWLIVSTGDVIALHHDATFFEVAYDVWQTCEDDTTCFNKRFMLAGSRFNIVQLMRFQAEFASHKIEDLGDIPAEELFERLTAVFAWSPAQLEKNLNHHALEFLYHYYRDREDILHQMILDSTNWSPTNTYNF